MTRYVAGAGLAVGTDASKAFGAAANVGAGKVCGATSTGVELVVANSAGEGDGVAPLVSVGVAVSSEVEGEGDFNESDG